DERRAARRSDDRRAELLPDAEHAHVQRHAEGLALLPRAGRFRAVQREESRRALAADVDRDGDVLVRERAERGASRRDGELAAAPRDRELADDAGRGAVRETAARRGERRALDGLRQAAALELDRVRESRREGLRELSLERDVRARRVHL